MYGIGSRAVTVFKEEASMKRAGDVTRDGSLDKEQRIAYNKTASYGEEDTDVEAILMCIEKRQVPPHVLRKLGLPQDWWKELSPGFVEKVAKTARERKKVLEELAKY